MTGNLALLFMPELISFDTTGSGKAALHSHGVFDFIGHETVDATVAIDPSKRTWIPGSP